MKIIVANWKMNHAFDETDSWLNDFFKNYATHYEQLKKVEMVLCPPAILLDYLDSELMEDGLRFFDEVAKKEGKKIEDFSTDEMTEIVIGSRPVKLGGQDCHFEKSGSFTGDISASMLRKVGCQYVILGHSERRAGHHESDMIVAKKVCAAVLEKLTPIICVGESKEVRERGQHASFISNQLLSSIPQNVKFNRLVIAYEPIWSIGTGLVPAMQQIAEVANLVKKIFGEKLSAVADELFLLYGGSVTSQNSKEILAIPEVDGLLVGKASLDAEEFIAISLS